jgi:hypothetical protein
LLLLLLLPWLVLYILGLFLLQQQKLEGLRRGEDSSTALSLSDFIVEMVSDKARLAAARLFGQPVMTPDHFLEV